MKLNPMLIAALVAALPGAALAQDVDSTKRIDKRQEQQQKRIEAGAKSGELNKREQARLEKSQARIEAEEKKAAADGKITKAERARIEKMQDEQGKQIRKERKDARAPANKAASAGSTTTAAAGTPGAYPSGATTRGQLEVLIGQEERKAMADGRISAEERVRLDQLYKERDARDRQKD